MQTPPPPGRQEAGSEPAPAGAAAGRASGHDVEHWLRTAGEARAAGRDAEARATLEIAARRFPDSAAVMHDLARVSEAMRDWRGAEQHWQGFLGLATHLWWAYAGLANALREQGLAQEADAALVGQFGPLGHEPWIFFEYALLAERAENWAQAAQRWADARRRFPDVWEGYGGTARAQRQLGDMPAARLTLTEAVDRFPEMAQPFHDIARLAEAGQDWVAAEQGWRGFLARDRGEWWAHTGLAHALRQQGRFDEAEAVLAVQFERLAHEPDIFFEYAGIAEQRGAWAEAAERYRSLTRRFPDRYHAALGLVYMLARLGRRSEGDAILRETIAANPGILELRLAFVRNIAEIGSAGTSGFLERSRQTLQDFPDEPEAHGFLADALSAKRLFEAAEDCLAAACARFPGTPDLLARRATNLAQLSLWDAALAVFDALDHVRLPDENAECSRADMLITAGLWDAADARIASGLERYPKSVLLQVLRLDVMIGSCRLDLAVEQWRAIERHFPATAGGLLFERRTRIVGLGYDPAEAAAGRASALQGPVRAADVVTAFESLGGWGLGCEFGLVQRQMGAEPLGLLRWAEIDTDGLTDALESAFNGVGQPEQTSLDTAGGALDEYVSEDRRFGMRIHTYVPAGQVAQERMQAQTCRRLSFLRQKLLDDLRRAEKIFVYKNVRRPLTDPELERLRLAIRRYGENVLLYVCYQSGEHRFPSIISPAPGLLIGHMDKMGMTPDGAPLPIPFDSWSKLMVSAYAAWKAAGRDDAVRP